MATSEWTTVSHKKTKPVKTVQVQTSPIQQTVMPTQSATVTARKSNNKNQSSMNALHVEKKADDGDFTLPTVSRGLQTQIQQARQQKGMTQQQLAVACNLQLSVIRSYEQGTCIPNSREMNVMSRVLGITLKNK